MNHDLLKRQCFQIEPKLAGSGPVGVVERAGDHHRFLRGDPATVPGAATSDELLDRGDRSTHRRRAAANLIRGRVEHDPPVVDHHDPFEQVGDLVDQVGRQDDRAGVRGVAGEQAVVEHPAGDRVEAGVGLVEEGDLRLRGQADDDPQGRAHTARELLDRPVRRQVEVAEQRLGEFAVPVRVEPRCRAQRVPNLEVGEHLVLAHEHHAAQDRVVLDRAGAEYPDAALRGELLVGDDAHQGALAGAVAAKKASDRRSFEVDRDVVERELVAVAASQAGHRDRHIVIPSCTWASPSAWAASDCAPLESRTIDTSASASIRSRAASATIGST